MEKVEVLYPVGMQSFEKIREEGFAYVDKTAFAYNLAKTGKYYFLSRPRRFGKSLFLSTLKAYFEGKHELFDGLAIAEKEKDWMQYPVLHIDLNLGKYKTDGQLELILDDMLAAWERIYSVDVRTTDLTLRFKHVIETAVAKTGRNVVILIDEYDKPLLENIGNEGKLDGLRATLKSFYGVMKTMDGFIKFAFVTGVTKFSKVSIFSDLNNLEDISLDAQYSTICGMTEEELRHNFDTGIRKLARTMGTTYEETCASLKKMYDGYHFYPGSEGVYNPFSILQCLKKSSMDSFWFESGTPTFLVELLKKADYDLRRLQEEKVDGDVLNSIDSLTTDPIPFFYQSGYLSIKGYDKRFKRYCLGFPNEEVEEGFTKYILPYYVNRPKSVSYDFICNFVEDLEAGNAEVFMKRLQTFFCDSDYRVAGDDEIYFQNVMYVVFRMMGFLTQVERATNDGRIDITVQTPKFIYIIEVKRDNSAQEALQQIEDKGYANAFAMDSRQIVKIGVNFSSKKRGIEDWVVA